MYDDGVCVDLCDDEDVEEKGSRLQDRVGRYATAFCLAAFCLGRRKGGRDDEDDDEKTVLIYMSHNFPPGCLLFGQEAALNE